MVIFDQLRISDNGSKMYIDAHVHNSETGTHLVKLYVATSDNISETSINGISDESKCIYVQTFTDETSVSLALSATSLTSFTKNTFSDDLFFVFIEDSGTGDPCVPCPISSQLSVAVTFDEGVFYQQVMDYTKQLANDCQIPQGFIDYILRWNAFKASVETEHWVSAIDFWKQLFGQQVSHSTREGGCGCHG